MFYKEEWLKKGGRFYICWLADSWPSRFSSIPQRQLWSEDIVRLSHDLQEVINSESGRPFNRFSLRLSSQLLRGLVRLYQRKTNAVLGILCNLDSKTMKTVNKKFAKKQGLEIKSSEEGLHIKELFIEKDKENDEEMHRILVHRGGVVPNIETITLREPIIPEVLPRDDGFGEEHPNQLLQQLLGDRTVEEMLLWGDHSLIQISGLDVTRLDIPDKLLDVTNLPPRRSLHMEKIPDQDITSFIKSAGVEKLFPIAENEKDFPPIPELPLPPQLEFLVPEVPIPEVPVPEVTIPEVPLPQEKQEKVPKDLEAQIEQMPEREPDKILAKRKDKVVPDLELQELEDTAPPKPKRRRRARRGPIIDNAIQIDTETYRARLADNYVECKCKTSLDDLANLNIPVKIYFRRPCHGGHRLFPNIATTLTGMFIRNLAVVQKTREEKTQEEEVPMPSPSRGIQRRSAVETVTVEINEIEPSVILPTTEPVVPQQMDISLMPTQKLYSPPKEKRRSIEEPTTTPKKRRVGQATIRKTRQLDISVPNLDQEKENIPPEFDQNITTQMQQDAPPTEKMQLVETIPPPELHQGSATEKKLMSLLEEAGIAEMEARHDEPKRLGLEEASKSKRTERGSESSETPLGSLDRTKVSLGDSAQTNDSIRQLREEWGTYRTMLKIVAATNRISPSPITVHSLVADIPDGTGRKRIAAARCFASVLKLKQYDFIRVIKEPGTQNIQNIILGPGYMESVS